MTKAELELENQKLQDRIDELEGMMNLGEGKLMSAATLEQTGYLEPLLLGACIGALRNPMTGVAYDEAEFQAYAPKFIDQAIRLHNMALDRLNALAESQG